MKNNKLTKYDYETTRSAIHAIFWKFWDREIDCDQSGEFDYEWMEACTDDILSLIKRQGGDYADNNYYEPTKEEIASMPLGGF